MGSVCLNLITALTALSFVSCAQGRTIPPVENLNVRTQLLGSSFAGIDDVALPLESASLLRARQGTTPELLRILPLGASIVRGLTSTPEDGFRKPLRDHLRSLGYKINMVGSRTNEAGSMRDGEHEGVSGHRIDQVSENLERTAGMKPNLVLINVGTNDCQQSYQLDTAMDRLSALVEKAWKQSPQATIILSTLLLATNNNPGIQDRVTQYNNGVRDLFPKLAADGRRIILADMQDGFIQATDLSDGIHPTGDGYRKMAAVWNHAIERAVAQNMIQAPEDNGAPEDTCPNVPGIGDGPYRHQGTGIDGIIPGTVSATERDFSKKMAFAQIINFGGDPDPKGALDEFLYWERVSGGLRLHYQINFGKGSFDTMKTVDLPFDCATDDIRWADIDGDRNDDFVCVQENGDLKVYLNTGAHSSDHIPAFKELPNFTVPPHDGTGAHVRLGDINGDGKTDYCIIGDDGNIRCWLNDDTWEDLGVVFTSKGKGDIRGTRFVDINGDGRADWIWVSDTGATDIYTNIKQPGDSKTPLWLRAANFHGGMSTPGIRDEILFGRVWGTDKAGRADYVWFKTIPEGNGFQFQPKLFRNDGGGGTSGYCDPNGQTGDANLDDDNMNPDLPAYSPS